VSADLVIGIDLGGTNMRAALYRGLAAAARKAATEPLGPEEEKALSPIAERREKVGSERAAATMVERMGSLVQALLDEGGVRGERVPVGIGLAGMLRGTSGIVAQSPHLGWKNVSLGDMMRTRLGEKHPVVVENDVNAITWGEFVLGAGRDVPDVLAVYVGTGIGGGAVCDGRLLRGGTGCAVEIGHTKVVFDDSARQCACGLKGCVEAYAGGEDLQRRARAELAGGARSAAVGLAGSPAAVNPGHLDAAAAEGDEYALNLWLEIGPLLGVALANAVTLFNPNRLILGGGVLSRTPVLKEHVIAALEVAINPPAQEDLAVENAALGDDAGIVGSALLALTPA
jgi:glucokinase